MTPASRRATRKARDDWPGAHWRYVNGGVYFARTDSPDPADDGLWYLSSVALGVSAAGP